MGGAAAQVPDFVAHYSMRGRRPFQNLSDLDEERLAAVIEDLTRERRNKHQRLFGRRYMELRHLTEARLRILLMQAGGRPARSAPHYFVLGSSAWFRGLYREPEEVVIPLGCLPSAVTSITYPDSFASMAFGHRFGLPHCPQPHHEQVFRVEDLPDLIATDGLPRDEPGSDYAGFEHRPFEKFIEVQLWSDEPIRNFLSWREAPAV